MIVEESTDSQERERDARIRDTTTPTKHTCFFWGFIAQTKWQSQFFDLTGWKHSNNVPLYFAMPTRKCMPSLREKHTRCGCRMVEGSRLPIGRNAVPRLTKVEKDGRRLGEIHQGCAFGELAVLRLTSGQSVTIKACHRHIIRAKTNRERQRETERERERERGGAGPSPQIDNMFSGHSFRQLA